MGGFIPRCACCCGGEERRVVMLEKYREGAAIVQEIEIWRNLFSQRRRKQSGDSHLSKISKKSKKSNSSAGSESRSRDDADTSDADDEDESSDEESVEDAVIDAATNSENRDKRRGTLWFHERKLQKDEGISADVLAVLPKLSATLTQIGIGKDARQWRLDGIQLEKFLNAGFFRLDRLLGNEGIHDLPLTDTGKPLLLRESLIRDLLKGDRVLKSVPAADASAAQRDLRNLSLRQLVHLKALNIDFAPGGNSVHANFLTILSGLVFERLGQKAVDSDDATDLPWAKRLGRDMVMVVGAAKQLPVPHVWAMWFAAERLFLHMGRLAVTNSIGMAFSETSDGVPGVLEFVERSEPDRTAGDGRLVLNLVVKHVTNESELSPKPTDTQSSPSSIVSRSVSQADIAKALGSLKKVQRD